jgi:hypothetical protein
MKIHPALLRLRWFPVIALLLIPFATALTGQVVAVDWGFVSYTSAAIPGTTPGFPISVGDFDFDGSADDKAKTVPFGTVFPPTTNANYNVPPGKTGTLYVGAQIASYNTSANPNFSAAGFQITAQSQLVVGNAAAASLIQGMSSAFYSIKSDFLNGANLETDLRLPDAADSLVLKTGNSNVYDSLGSVTRFLVQSAGQWYISVDSVSTHTTTFSINGAQAMWYAFDPSVNQFLDLNNLGSMFLGSTLEDITAFGVYSLNPAFDGTVANTGHQAIAGFSALLVVPNIPEAGTLSWVAGLTLTGLVAGLYSRRKAMRKNG